MLGHVIGEPFVRLVCVLGLYVGSVAGYLMFFLRDAVLFPPLSRRLPAPPGTVRAEQSVAAVAELSNHCRVYDVERPYREVADFIKAEFPRRGWRLVEEGAQVSAKSRAQESWASVEMVFRGPYILPWHMGVRVLAGLRDGVQTGRTTVGIDDPNWTAVSRAQYC